MAKLTDYQRLVNRIQKAVDELTELDSNVKIAIEIQVPTLIIGNSKLVNTKS